MSKWTEYLNQYYKDKKSSNPKYTFTQAMKDASKSYKKSKTVKSMSSSEDECIKKCMKKGGSKKNRSKKNRNVKGGTVAISAGNANTAHIEPLSGDSVVSPHAPATGVAVTAATV
jgi:hypothetical protein